jgi:hypothetical protein
MHETYGNRDAFQVLYSRATQLTLSARWCGFTVASRVTDLLTRCDVRRAIVFTFRGATRRSFRKVIVGLPRFIGEAESDVRNVFIVRLEALDGHCLDLVDGGKDSFGRQETGM